MIDARITNVGNRISAVARMVVNTIRVALTIQLPAVYGTSVSLCHSVVTDADIIGREVRASMVLIRDVRLADFVKVDKDVVWVTPEMWDQFMVMSNVDWIIT